MKPTAQQVKDLISKKQTQIADLQQEILDLRQMYDSILLPDLIAQAALDRKVAGIGANDNENRDAVQHVPDMIAECLADMKKAGDIQR